MVESPPENIPKQRKNSLQIKKPSSGDLKEKKNLK
jgi:hypothetical protein